MITYRLLVKDYKGNVIAIHEFTVNQQNSKNMQIHRIGSYVLSAWDEPGAASIEIVCLGYQDTVYAVQVIDHVNSVVVAETVQ